MSDLYGNPKDRLSRDAAKIIYYWLSFCAAHISSHYVKNRKRKNNIHTLKTLPSSKPKYFSSSMRGKLNSQHILNKIIEGSANSFSLSKTLKVTLFKIKNNVCRQGPFEISSYTDEQLGNINGFQKANGGNKIHSEDSEIFVNF